MEINICINFLLSASQNVVFKYFSEQLTVHGITPAQYGVLNCLWQHGELKPTDIRALLKLKASSVSGILDKMQKEGLIDRAIDPDNRRAIIVTATKKAMDMRPAIEKIVDTMNEKFLEPFSEEERVVLRKALQTIIASD